MTGKSRPSKRTAAFLKDQALFAEQMASGGNLPPETNETSDAVAEAEAVISKAIQAQEQMCGICHQSKDGKYPFCAPCFDALPLCVRCGDQTGHRGYYNASQKKQMGLCSVCFTEKRHQPKTVTKPAPTAQAHNLQTMWSRLLRAKALIDLYQGADPDFVPTLRDLYEKAETACDLEDLDTCDKQLRTFWYTNHGFELADRLAEPADSELEGYTFRLWDHARICYEAGEYLKGKLALISLEGILEYEDWQTEDAARIEEASTANIRRHFEAIKARKEEAERVNRNRQARMEFMGAQSTAPAATPYRRPAQPADQSCLICGTLSQMRLCHNCFRGLPICPNCNDRKVHVANDGTKKQSCFPCYKDQCAADDLQTPEPKQADPERTKREADRRSRQLSRSYNPNRNLSSDGGKRSKKTK